MGLDMPEIKKIIKEIADSFYKDALAYYLHFESSEQRLAQTVKNSLKEKYGKQIFMPAIHWNKTVGPSADTDAFDDAISAYLEDLSYQKEKFVLPKNRFTNMLWNKVRQDGQKIISEMTGN